VIKGGELMQKEHGQVTGIIWRGAEDLAAYQLVKQYAQKNSLTVSAAAKELLKIGIHAEANKHN
jgi:hypothetical protein